MLRLFVKSTFNSMIENKINNLREKINELDDHILHLLDDRSKIVNEIGKLKDKSRSVIDKNREDSILRRLLKNPELRNNMSITAKESVLDGFSWNHYVDRAIMAYEKLKF